MNIIAGNARGVELVVTDDMGVRPTSVRARKALFDSLGDISGLHILDLFAGSGALALEAASRGAASVAMMEISPSHINAINENCRRVAAAEVNCPMQVINCDSTVPENSLPRLKQIPQLIFADPPYAESARFFAALFSNAYFCKTLAGARLFWELPDTPGSAGNFLTAARLDDMKLRRFGSTTFLTGIIK